MWHVNHFPKGRVLMFLAEPDRTSLDLQWRMFGTSVRVHPFFWLVAAFLGWPAVDQAGGLRFLAIWIVCVFISILLHEFGHVFVGRLFGSAGHIVLYGLGGLAIGSNNLSNRWQRIAVSFAGPAAQLLLFGLVYGLIWLRPSWFGLFDT